MVSISKVATAVATSSVAACCLMDTGPILFMYDLLLCSKKRLRKAFENKRIWIVGASSGIGAELAEQLSSHGARLLLSGRNEANLLEVAEKCGGRERNPVLCMDITCDSRQMEQTIDTAVSRMGGIDILILNSGIGQLQLALDDDGTEESSPGDAVAQKLMQVNYIGPARMATRVIRRDGWQQRPQGGHIVVTSSVAAKMAVPLSSAYAASKHAVHGYFSSLRSECSPWLRIDLPCPGPVATPFDRNIYRNKHNKKSCIAQDSAKKAVSSATDDSEGERKMSTQRCVRLMVSAMAGHFSEPCIAQQSTLGFMLLQQHFPGLAQKL